jgi:inhibitor of cysteine peptidase
MYEQRGSKVLKRICSIAMLLATFTLAAGCAPQEVKLGVADSGRTVELAKGQTVVITLEANPTTGYTWAVAELEEHILQRVGEIEFKPQSDLVGAPGVQTLRFQAADPGQTALKLVYHRPWEKGVEPLKSFSLQVVVR